jgi:cation diffusion facilitator CzcD-associated flavoprotein CzcO/amino acid transporter
MSPTAAPSSSFANPAQKHLLTTPFIVFLVVAAAAPLASMIGNLPIAIARGTGAAVPVAFLLAGLTLLAFTVGYGAIGRRVVSTGAFYTYVAKGLGKPAGVGAAYTAVVAYTVFTFGLAAACGYFDGVVLDAVGVHVAWPVCAAVSIAICAILGYRSVDVSSRVLAVILIIEVALLVVFDVSVVVSRGWAAFPLESFSPATIIAPGIGVSLMTAFTCFVGFESGALYSKEAADPTRSVPLASYVAVVSIGSFYLITAWITIGALSPAAAVSEATEKSGMLLLDLVQRYDGETASDVTGILLCTSLLASYIAIHAAATRYVFALARERLLPRRLGKFHPTLYAPSSASVAITLSTAICIGLLASAKEDPYAGIVPVLIGLGTLGIVALQMLAGIAIVAYLMARRRETRWYTLLAATIAAIGLVLATAAVSGNFTLLATNDAPWVPWLPGLYIATFAGGLVYGLWVRTMRPAIYRNLVAVELRADDTRRTLLVPGTKLHGVRYCIIGAGPSGLVAARALRMAGIPYDHFERHSDVGGIWDIESSGSPIYRSTHLISSKHLSGFFGYPMPESYPDYPSHAQVLSYIRDFARHFGLSDGIRFGTEVRSAEPLGVDAADGWRVTTSDGATEDYTGLVCAPGVAWHPNIPDYDGLEEFTGEVRHSVSFQDAAEFTGRRVLVVGGGNSGADIACEAAATAATAGISLRRGYHFIPKHLFGTPTDVFFTEEMRPPKGVAVPEDPTLMIEAMAGDPARFGLPKPDHKLLESHPVLNSEILHHLAHGRLACYPDIAHFTADRVVFVDGTEAPFDLVLLATGYYFRLPFLDERMFTWDRGHPELYLNIFHPKFHGLAIVGHAEFAAAGYRRFDEMAQMVAMDAVIEATGRGREAWRRLKRGDRPDLRGPSRYIESDRHAHYVDVPTYQRVLSELRERFGWPDPTDRLFQDGQV